MDLSKNIRDIRESLKIKQIEMANALDIDPPNYARLEKRGNKLSFEQLQQIAAVFQMSVVEIIEYPNVVVAGADSKELERVKELEKRIEELQEIIQAQRQDIKNYYIIEFQTFIDYLYFVLIDIDNQTNGQLNKATWEEIESEWDKKIGIFPNAEQIALDAKESPLGIAKLSELFTSIMAFRERLGQVFGYKERPLLKKNKEF